jgi:dTDP-4-amino-4,6-dideoxy-D-glucose ammonia-lyase
MNKISSDFSLLDNSSAYIHNDKFSSKLKLFFNEKIDDLKKDNIEINSQIKSLSSKINLVDSVIEIVLNLSKDPFLSYEKILVKLNVTNLELDIINSVVRNIPEFQEIIIGRGIGTKYWKNMIIPLINSQSIDNFISKKYSFPFRVGIYSGLSCMFECSFCGRNYNAKYERTALDKGIEIYKKLIDEAPSDDPNRFYISGGLEPLTNPKNGEIIEYLKRKNFNSSMYTNAHMLTPKFLEKNPEIFNLDSLRISFYGVDSEQTTNVTKKKNAYEIVTANIENYIIQKYKKKSKTSFGLNYVILKDREDDLIKLINIISNINKKANLPKKNSFDFITLREDFSIYGERMTDFQREKLSTNIKKVDKLVSNNVYLKNLYIDYGFALEPLRRGHLEEKFENIFAEKKDLESLGVPQASVAVDLYGDVYLYREAAFLDRPGAKRYIIGNLLKEGSMQNVVSKFIAKPKKIEILESDRDYLDTWDHITVRFSELYKKNIKLGFPMENSAINIKTINKILNIKHQVHFASEK